MSAVEALLARAGGSCSPEQQLELLAVDAGHREPRHGHRLAAVVLVVVQRLDRQQRCAVILQREDGRRGFSGSGAAAVRSSPSSAARLRLRDTARSARRLAERKKEKKHRTVLSGPRHAWLICSSTSSGTVSL